MNLIQLFFNNEGPRLALTPKHWAVLAGVQALGPVGTCCADLQRYIKAECDNNEPRIGTLYALLSDLAESGLLKTVDVESGGRPRRLYQLTRVGQRALALGETMAQHRAHDVVQPA